MSAPSSGPGRSLELARRLGRLGTNERWTGRALVAPINSLGYAPDMQQVLILDDLPDSLHLLKVALQDEFDVVTAQSVEAAERSLNAGTSVALIDVRLSPGEPWDKGGIAFLWWAKDHFPRLPVVMMSGYHDFDAIVVALNAGADYFLEKPIDVRQLVTLLRALSERDQHPEGIAELRRRLRCAPR